MTKIESLKPTIKIEKIDQTKQLEVKERLVPIGLEASRKTSNYPEGKGKFV